jgi:hypothetical protein
MPAGIIRENNDFGDPKRMHPAGRAGSRKILPGTERDPSCPSGAFPAPAQRLR